MPTESYILRPEFYEAVADVLRNARVKSYRAVNFIMVDAYWNVGRMIVEEEQQGQERAKYGIHLLRGLSLRLSEDFGKGFDEREVRKIRQLYITFPIRDALRPELSWTHYRSLIRVENETARKYYLTEAAEQNWSTRALDRQIGSIYYERMLMSSDKAPECGVATRRLRRGQAAGRSEKRYGTAHMNDDRFTTQEYLFACPHCGEPISMVLDLSAGSQRYVEDCEVCCNPIEIDFEVEEGAVVSFQARIP